MTKTERVALYRNAIKRLEEQEARGIDEGLADPEFDAVRKALRCREREWFDMTMASHPRIVALGIALAITEGHQRRGGND